MRSTAALLLLIAAACGGKIAGDPEATRTGSGSSGSSGSSGGGVSPYPVPSSSSSSSTEPAPPPPASSSPLGDPSKATVEDACGAICKRDGECGAQQPDCLAHCTSDIRGAAGCSSEGDAYIQCYASNLEPGCAALPPACENAYCAYTRCAGKVVPTYCH